MMCAWSGCRGVAVGLVSVFAYSAAVAIVEVVVVVAFIVTVPAVVAAAAIAVMFPMTCVSGGICVLLVILFPMLWLLSCSGSWLCGCCLACGRCHASGCALVAFHASGSAFIGGSACKGPCFGGRWQHASVFALVAMHARGCSLMASCY